MARFIGIYNKEQQKVVWYNPDEAPKSQSRDSAAPYVIQDSMDAVAHPCTGKLMDSKSEFRKTTKAHGCVEVGNEKPSAPKAQKLGGIREDLVKAAAQYGIDWS